MTSLHSHVTNKKRGILLYVALVIAAVVFIYLAALISSSVMHNMENKHSQNVAKATFAAESAMEEAIPRLQEYMKKHRDDYFKNNNTQYSNAKRVKSKLLAERELLKKLNKDNKYKKQIDKINNKIQTLKLEDTNISTDKDFPFKDWGKLCIYKDRIDRDKNKNTDNDKINYEYAYYTSTNFPYEEGYIIAAGRVREAAEDYKSTSFRYVTKYISSKIILQYQTPISNVLKTNLDPATPNKENEEKVPIISAIWTNLKAIPLPTWIGITDEVAKTNDLIPNLKGKIKTNKLLYNELANDNNFIDDYYFNSNDTTKHHRKSFSIYYSYNDFKDLLDTIVKSHPSKWKVYTTKESNDEMPLEIKNTLGKDNILPPEGLQELKGNIIGNNLLLAPMVHNGGLPPISNIEPMISTLYLQPWIGSKILTPSTQFGNIGSEQLAIIDKFWSTKKSVLYQGDLVLGDNLDSANTKIGVLVVTGDLEVQGQIRGTGALIVLGDLKFTPNTDSDPFDNIVIYAAGNIICNTADRADLITGTEIGEYLSIPKSLLPRLAAFVREENKNSEKYELGNIDKEQFAKLINDYHTKYSSNPQYWDDDMELWYKHSIFLNK